jgi:hypothetical protein
LRSGGVCDEYVNADDLDWLQLGIPADHAGVKMPAGQKEERTGQE